MFGVKKDLNIHFIGIGGIGMSGIAEVLLNLGYKISGSDLNLNDNCEKLEKLGATIIQGHAAKNIDGAQLIVYSSAVKQDNPEMQAAHEQKIPTIQRAEMLAELMRLKFGLAVAGSHGKTTTTSFLATILDICGLKPTCIIGGKVKNLGSHAFKGSGDILVAEADESDGSFLFLNPIMSIITNIDNDHLDYYKTESELEKAFLKFCHKIPFYGKVAINLEDAKSRELLSQIRRPYITFGFTEEADYWASDRVFTSSGSEFKFHHKDEIVATKISLNGDHNILNALAAMALAHQLSLSLSDISQAIAKFEGVARRFDILHNGDFTVVDDYGHHPTEIKSTLKTAKKMYPDRKIIAIFEPHRFSRTKEHWKDFVSSFSDVDKVYISKIYPASEQALPNITSVNLIADINKENGNAELLEDWKDIEQILNIAHENKYVIMSLGAGAISTIMRSKVKAWISQN